MDSSISSSSRSTNSTPKFVRTTSFLARSLIRFAQVLGEDTETLKKTLGSLGIVLKPVLYKMDVRPLLRLVLAQFFGPATGFVDMLVQHVPSPVEAAKLKVRLLIFIR